jgi:glycerophosphoryl diester phosphodiesterase
MGRASAKEGRRGTSRALLTLMAVFLASSLLLVSMASMRVWKSLGVVGTLVAGSRTRAPPARPGGAATALKYAPENRFRRSRGAHDMLLYANGGATGRCPENTIASFEKAFELGADGIQGGLRLLRDGTVIVHGDDDTLRRVSAPGDSNSAAADAQKVLDTDLSRLNWEQVRDVDIGSRAPPDACLWWGGASAWERPLLASDFLAVVGRGDRGGRRALIELHNRAFVRPALAAARVFTRRNELDNRYVAVAPGAITWISSDVAVASAMKRGMPMHEAFILAHVSAGDGPQQAAAGCRQVIDAAKAAGLDGVVLAALPDVVTRDIVEFAKREGLQVGVWVSRGLTTQLGVPLDTPANIATFRERGVDFFSSELPPEVIEAEVHYREQRYTDWAQRTGEATYYS